MVAVERWTRQYGPGILVHIGVVLAWYAWVHGADVPAYVMPGPWETMVSLGDEYDWWHNGLVTAGEIFAGYALAVVVGILLAMMFTWSPTFSLALMPLIVSTNMIPKVALGPLIIVWMSHGFVTNAVIAFSICFLPILLTTARGLKEIEPELVDLARSLKASRWQIFAKIQLPGSLPYVFSGMKVAVVLAVAGAIVGEFLISEEGLGYLMLQVQVTLDMAAMVMAVLLITLIGIILYAMVLVLERLVVVGDRRVDA